ncbi:hypothetical protein CQW23_11269 [Capsicum baccatum]|uniref:Uncharacterized protein n=1 Tax=Capsicum baccatum TaxID=33114 RepID=A0A2G2WPC1_CAPBA|nr:hypothetical protein CQW23_11269 [Capsicum baccatum]
MHKQASRNMDITLRKGTSPLRSPKPSAVPDPSLSGSRETNENEKPQKQKPMTKNFMSPTISASSKASIRKKILAERNEISSSCNSLPPHKASNLGSKTSPLNSISRRSSESENDQENTSVVDSYYRPYDPLTNDLGPRPKYLRYKPYRRRGTFLDLQDDNEGSLQQARDPSKLPEEHNLELENDEGVADSVEDDDEEMEEGRGTFLDLQDDNEGSLQQARDPSKLPEEHNLELENDEGVADSVEDDDEEMEEGRGTFLDLQDDNEGSLQQARDPSKLPEEHNLELENDEGVADSVEDDDEEMEEGRGTFLDLQDDNEGSLQQARDPSKLPEEHNLELENDEGVADSVEDDDEEMEEGRGTFLDLQDDNEGSLQQARDPSKLPEEHNLELENDEGVVDSVEDDDEEMEEDVDGEWRLKGLFKILLLLVVFFMSCSNLSSTNSVVSSGSGDMIRKNIFEAVFHEIYGSESAYVDHLEDSQSSYELNNAVYEYIEDIVESLQVGSAEMEKTTEPQEGQSADKDIDQNSMDVEVAQNDVVHGDEEDETMSTAAGEGLDEQLQRDESLEKNDPEQENFAVLLDDISSSNYDDKVEQVEKISHERTGEVETSETASGGAEEIEISNLDTELVSENGPGNAAIIIGVSAASVLLVVTILFTRKPKASIEAPQAEVPNNTVIASVEGELSERKTETSVKVSALPEPLDDPSENHRNSHPERTPAIGSITQAASSLCGPKQEASKEISYISAPKISLLGEIMVGEVSSSLRSCVRKNIKTEAAEGNTNLSRSVLLPPAQPSAVEEHYIADSPSHGSFTAEKKILKKKVEKDGEEVKKVVLTTPVRRSSRIRDRVGMSP